MSPSKAIVSVLVACVFCNSAFIAPVRAEGLPNARPVLADSETQDSNNPVEALNQQIHILENRVAALEAQVAALQQAKNASDAQLAAQPQIDELKAQVADLQQWKADIDKQKAAIAAIAATACGVLQAGQPVPPQCASVFADLLAAPYCKDTPNGQTPPPFCK